MILRGGTDGPNYDADTVRAAAETLTAAGLPGRVVIDCSHANSGKDHIRQATVADEVAQMVRDGLPISGDVTNQIHLYDAGTEYDQEPGVGDATGPRQPSPDFGPADPIAMVRRLGSVVTLTSGATFTLPHCFHPVASPVSCSSVAYSSMP